MKNILLFIFCILSLSVFSQTWQWLTKVDSAPSCSWQGGVTSIGNSLYSVVFAYADTLYFPGSSVPVPPYSYCLVKTDNNGNIIWVRPLGKEDGSIFLTHNSENIFLTGMFSQTIQIDSFSINPVQDDSLNNSQDIFLVCFDTLGNIKWLNSIGNKCYDTPFDIQADFFGNVFLTGKIPSLCNPYYESMGEFFLSKFNSLGQLVWNKTLDSTIYFPHINIGTDRDIYFTGTFNDSIKFTDSLNSWSYYKSPGGGFLVKMDSNLYIEWIKILEVVNQSSAFPSKPMTDNNQNVYLPVGTQGSFTCDNYNFNGSAIIKLNSTGIINQYMYTSTGTPQIKYMPDNTIGVIGNTTNFHKILKIGTGLNIIYTENILYHHYWGKHEVFFDSDNNGNFLIGGNTSDSLSFSNSTLLLPMLNFYQTQTYYTKFGYALSADVNNYTLGEDLSLIVSPNPSTGIFTINSSEFGVHSSVLKIYTVLGEKIIEQTVNRGQETINLSSQPKGIYFIQILADGKREVKKIVVE